MTLSHTLYSIRLIENIYLISVCATLVVAYSMYVHILQVFIVYLMKSFALFHNRVHFAEKQEFHFVPAHWDDVI